MAEFLPLPMHKATAAVLGVLNGSSPLEVVKPHFSRKLASQETPLAGFNNTLSFSLQSTVNLAAGSVISISGILGAASDRSPWLTLRKDDASNDEVVLCAGPGPAGSGNAGTWRDAEGARVLAMTVCDGATWEARAEYEVGWRITNPGMAQASPAMSIAASGTPAFEVAEMDKPMTDTLGVTAGHDALRVVVPWFESKAIGQSTFLAGAVNTISATLMTNIGIEAQAEISMCCFEKAVVAGDRVAVSVTGGVGTVLPRFCADDQEGYAAWFPDSATVQLRLCAGSGNSMRSLVEVVVRFNVANPHDGQASPAVLILAVGRFTIASAAMLAPDGIVYQGVTDGAKPMKVVVPEFVTHAIYQSSPFAGLMNHISVTLQTSVPLAGAQGAEITLTGLNAGDQGSSNVTLEGLVACRFCFGLSNAIGKASYTSSSGTMLLRVCPNATLPAETLYHFSFQFRNPLFDQPASVIQIRAQSLLSAAGGAFAIPATELDHQGLTVYGVVNATDPLRTIVPTFAHAFMSQTNFYGGEVKPLNPNF